jgi:hypothetical protein
MPYEGPYAPPLWPQGATRIGALAGPWVAPERSWVWPRLMGTRGAGDNFDTTSDTTQDATPGNGRQPPANNSA